MVLDPICPFNVTVELLLSGYLPFLGSTTKCNSIILLFLGHRNLIKNKTQTAVINILNLHIMTWRFVCTLHTFSKVTVEIKALYLWVPFSVRGCWKSWCLSRQHVYLCFKHRASARTRKTPKCKNLCLSLVNWVCKLLSFVTLLTWYTFVFIGWWENRC